VDAVMFAAVASNICLLIVIRSSHAEQVMTAITLLAALSRACMFALLKNLTTYYTKTKMTFVADEQKKKKTTETF